MQSIRIRIMKGIIINIDLQGIINEAGTTTMTVEQNIKYLLRFAGRQVTNYFLDMCDSIAVFPSKTRTSVLNKSYQKLENEIEVDYSEYNVCKGAHHFCDAWY